MGSILERFKRKPTPEERTKNTHAFADMLMDTLAGNRKDYGDATRRFLHEIDPATQLRNDILFARLQQNSLNGQVVFTYFNFGIDNPLIIFGIFELGDEEKSIRYYGVNFNPNHPLFEIKPNRRKKQVFQVEPDVIMRLRDSASFYEQSYQSGQLEGCGDTNAVANFMSSLINQDNSSFIILKLVHKLSL